MIGQCLDVVPLTKAAAVQEGYVLNEPSVSIVTRVIPVLILTLVMIVVVLILITPRNSMREQLILVIRVTRGPRVLTRPRPETVNPSKPGLLALKTSLNLNPRLLDTLAVFRV